VYHERYNEKMNVLGVVRRFFDSLLDAVAPMQERAMRTKTRSLEDIPLAPTAHELLGARITTIMNYRDAAVQDLIRSLKYDGSGAAAALAAAALADYLREELASARQFSPREILLVPIPLHRSRKRERGFNQIEIVLKALPPEFRDGALSLLAPEVLVRAKATRQQAKLSRKERVKNVAGAFEVPHPSRIKNTHIFLIDDVATTGATLVNAGKSLKKCDAEVTLLALARA
jgi:ComF family protein